jgi:NAD(P)-dependent dehydrogenase (short-subunit alcohol dehydrogenase family)
VSTIAVVGVGPGLGLSVATAFGGHGFDVALISRDRAHLDGHVGRLAEAGVTAAAFPANVADRAALADALRAAAARFGRIDVLEYSPYPGLVRVAPEELTVAALQPQIDEILYGAVTATEVVLPDMLAAGSGTLLYTVGGGAINPYPFLGSVNTAQAALRNWVHNLNATLAGRGVHAADVVVNVGISTEPTPGRAQRHPDELAQLYWDLHVNRDEREIVVNP